jgi:hypothetical protein
MMSVGAARCARSSCPHRVGFAFSWPAPGARRTGHRQLRTNDVLSIGRDPAVTRVSHSRSSGAPARRVRRHALRHQNQSHTGPSASAPASRRSQFGSPAPQSAPVSSRQSRSVNTLCQLRSVSYALSVTLCQLRSVSYALSVTLCQLRSVSYTVGRCDRAASCRFDPRRRTARSRPASALDRDLHPACSPHLGSGPRRMRCPRWHG